MTTEDHPEGFPSPTRGTGVLCHGENNVSYTRRETRGLEDVVHFLRILRVDLLWFRTFTIDVFDQGVTTNGTNFRTVLPPTPFSEVTRLGQRGRYLTPFHLDDVNLY